MAWVISLRCSSSSRASGRTWRSGRWLGVVRESCCGVVELVAGGRECPVGGGVDGGGAAAAGAAGPLHGVVDGGGDAVLGGG